MKRSLFLKIIAWIWRGAALLLAVYFLVAFFTDTPFFFTNVGVHLEDEKSWVDYDSLSIRHDINSEQRFASTIAFDIRNSAGAKYVCAAAPTITCTYIPADEWVLHTDNLIIENYERFRGECNTKIIGLRTPRYYTVDGEIKTVDLEGYPNFIRSYSSPMLPVIDTGSSVYGMLLLAAIPIFLSLVYSFICPRLSLGSQKAVLRYGANAKLVVTICTILPLLTSTVLFYLAPAYYYTGQIVWFPLIRWLTPIISIPALSIWIASFKNKKLAPAVAAGIMVLCLYQPLANLICLFATVIAWGYFVEGIRRFFARFKKRKAA